jgi:3-methyladenine DNA glycosylase/8-oxoguanine DNA glycosylase
MLQRRWQGGWPVDVLATVAPLRHGSADPAHHVDGAGSFWWACRTPDGDGTLTVAADASLVTGRAWGPGADWLLERLPTLLGAADDWSGLDVAAVPVLRETRRRLPGMRLPSTGRVLDALVPAVLEQKVTGREARRSWRELVRRFGTPAPGPAQRLFVPPAPHALLDMTTWDWHLIGVDLRRQRTIRAAAAVAARLEECVTLPLQSAVQRLRLVPGVGAWTAAETVQRALGHPDAVSVGDYHLPHLVTYLFTGRRRGSDEEMLELLAPWDGQRQRVMRLVEASGIAVPRHGPRFSAPDLRAI